jgi:hypothetical protein
MSQNRSLDRLPSFPPGAAADERPSATGAPHTPRTILGLCLLLLAAATLVGCASLKGDGFPEADATWGTKYRTPPASKRQTEPFFLDEKSQQIERSLGL